MRADVVESGSRSRGTAARPRAPPRLAHHANMPADNVSARTVAQTSADASLRAAPVARAPRGSTEPAIQTLPATPSWWSTRGAGEGDGAVRTLVQAGSGASRRVWRPPRRA